MAIWPDDLRNEELDMPLPSESVQQDLYVRASLDQLNAIVDGLDQSGGIAGLDDELRIRLQWFQGTLGYRVRITRDTNGSVYIESPDLLADGWSVTEPNSGLFRVTHPSRLGDGTVIVMNANRRDFSPLYHLAHIHSTAPSRFDFVIGRFQPGAAEQMQLAPPIIDIDLLFVPDAEAAVTDEAQWPDPAVVAHLGDPETNDPKLSKATIQSMLLDINSVAINRDKIGGFAGIDDDGAVRYPSVKHAYNACRIRLGGGADLIPEGWVSSKIATGTYRITFPNGLQDASRITMPVITCRAPDTANIWTAYLSSTFNTFARQGTMQIITAKHQVNSLSVTVADCAFDLICPNNLMTVMP